MSQQFPLPLFSALGWKMARFIWGWLLISQVKENFFHRMNFPGLATWKIMRFSFGLDILFPLCLLPFINLGATPQIYTNLSQTGPQIKIFYFMGSCCALLQCPFNIITSITILKLLLGVFTVLEEGPGCPSGYDAGLINKTSLVQFPSPLNVS